VCKTNFAHPTTSADKQAAEKMAKKSPQQPPSVRLRRDRQGWGFYKKITSLLTFISLEERVRCLAVIIRENKST